VYPLPGASEAWQLKLGAGAMLLDVSMNGRAAPPFHGQSDAVLVPAGMLEAAAAWQLSPRSSLELRGFVAACTDRVVVRLGGRRAAAFGQPFAGLTFGVAFGVF